MRRRFRHLSSKNPSVDVCYTVPARSSSSHVQTAMPEGEGGAVSAPEGGESKVQASQLLQGINPGSADVSP